MMQITAIPTFRDNYVWALHGEWSGTSVAVLVDPGEPGAILSWLLARKTRPIAILVTHHHADHVGALETLCQRWPMPVFAPRKEAIVGTTHAVAEGDEVLVPELGLNFKVWETPGHTRGHVCYLGHGNLFSGDTLFSCGCGRLFEGSAAHMHASLQRLATLPPETRVYCAHEYTLPNIGFARELEADNPALEVRYQEARARRKAKQPTLPSSMARELATNPFLRCHIPAVRAALEAHFRRTLADETEAFALLRQWKDVY